MLKKFTNFTQDMKNESSKKDVLDKSCPCVKSKTTQKEPVVKEPVVKNPKIKEPIVKEPVVKESVVTNTLKDFIFYGKIVEVQSTIKPSNTLTILENHNISKDKLHYIINEIGTSIVLLKYNTESGKNLKPFVETLFNYYKLNNIRCDNILFEGDNKYIIIKNINNKEILNKIKTDLINLLK
jgi:hypothetical protein